LSIFPKPVPNANGGPGSLINQAFAIGQRIAEHLAHVIDVIEAAVEREQYRRFVLTDVADATGACVLRFEGAVDRDFELVTYAAACSVANQPFSIYHSSVDDRSLIYARNNPAVKFGDNFGAGEYLPDGTPLVIVFTGQTPGSQCTFTCRARILSSDPAFVPRARASGGGFLPGELLAMPSTAEAAPTEGMVRKLHGGG
jgi:hypothetical protein